jgi:hypothetical protein
VDRYQIEAAARERFPGVNAGGRHVAQPLVTSAIKKLREAYQEGGSMVLDAMRPNLQQKRKRGLMSKKIMATAIRSQECNRLAIEFGEFLGTYYEPHFSKVTGRLDGFCEKGKTAIIGTETVLNLFF